MQHLKNTCTVKATASTEKDEKQLFQCENSVDWSLDCLLVLFDLWATLLIEFSLVVRDSQLL